MVIGPLYMARGLMQVALWGCYIVAFKTNNDRMAFFSLLLIAIMTLGQIQDILLATHLKR